MIQLLINGVNYYNLKTCNINLSMDTLCNAFQCSITDRWTPDQETPVIQPFDRVDVLIDSQKIIHGYIDKLTPRISADYNDIMVSGRDNSGDLVDCCVVHKSNEWLGLKLDVVVSDICKPFGVKVSAQTDIGAPIAYFKLEQGMTAFDAIEKLCSLRSVMAISDGSGGIAIVAASNISSGEIISEDFNLETGNVSYDASARFSEYIVKGQKEPTESSVFGGGGDSDGEETFSAVGSVKDLTINRYRPTIIIESAPVDKGVCTKIAKWTLAKNIGKSKTFTVKVKGFYKRSGALWKINELIRLTSRHLQVDHDLLCSMVSFELSAQGEYTQLTLVPRDAYIVIPDVALEKPKTSSASNLFSGGDA